MSEFATVLLFLRSFASFEPGSSTALTKAGALLANCQACNRFEAFGHILARMRTCEVDLQVVFLGKLRGLFLRDLAVGFVVHLGRYQHLQHVCIGEGFDLTQPRTHVIEAGQVRHVERQQDATCSLVVALRYRAEPFLPRCVPNLQLYGLAVHAHILHLEVDPCADQARVSGQRYLPMVAMCCMWKVFSANQSSSDVLPHEVSPMMINLIKWSTFVAVPVAGAFILQ